MTVPSTVAVVGAGLAGGKAVEALRAEGFGGRIVLFGDEPHRPYERPPLSKGYLQGNDQQTAVQAEQTAVSRNEPIQWTNPETGNRGTIEPTRTYQGESGQTCREYQHIVYVGGRAEQARGNACQQPDGTWRILS